MPPLTTEELLLQLPRSIRGTGGAWLSVSDGPEGRVWTAGFENVGNKEVRGRYFMGDTPREALTRLHDHHRDYKIAQDIINRPVGGRE